MGKLVFVTGGVRSGKSRHALDLVSGRAGSVLFVATALPSDSEMSLRISRHRAERPGTWRTAEVVKGGLAEGLAGGDEDVLLLDCVGLYVSRRMMEGADGEKAAAEAAEAAGAAAGRFDYSVFVSNEVGWGLVPANELGRSFIEALGAANRQVAALADEVVLMVSGIPVKIK